MGAVMARPLLAQQLWVRPSWGRPWLVQQLWVRPLSWTRDHGGLRRAGGEFSNLSSGTSCSAFTYPPAIGTARQNTVIMPAERLRWCPTVSGQLCSPQPHGHGQCEQPHQHLKA